MKRIKPLIFLIAVFITSLAAALIAGCRIGQPQNLNPDKDGLTAHVTYYSNGGTFSTTGDNKRFKDFFFFPGTPIVNIGEDEVENVTIARSGYVFTGWQYCELDGDGLPKYYDGEDYANQLPAGRNGTPSITNADGSEIADYQKEFFVKPTGEAVFSASRPTLEDGEHIYVCATWAEDVRIQYKLVTEDGQPLVLDGLQFNNGDVLCEASFGGGTQATLHPDNPDTTTNLLNNKKFNLDSTSHTYLSLYKDEDCTMEYAEGDKIDKPEGDESAVVFVKYIKGDWTVIKTAQGRNDGVTTMFNRLNGSQNFYIHRDIDCTGRTVTIRLGQSTFNGEINGNNHTITGLTFYSTPSDATLNNGGTGSVFGKFGATANVHDLTLKDIKVQVSVRSASTCSFYLVSHDIAADAQFDFAIEGADVELTCPSSSHISNLQSIEGVYNTSHWLYGGGSSDADFESRGITLSGVSLKINDSTVIAK